MSDDIHDADYIELEEDVADALVIAEPQRNQLLAAAVQTYIAGLAANTQRAYQSRINAFLEWQAEQESAPLVAHLKAYVGYLREDRELAPRSIQAHVNTIKGLLRTAAALEPELANRIPQLELVKPPPVRGQMQGKRLTSSQARQLLQAPGKDDPKGMRDTAILGLLVVLGLRRSEVCDLTWGHITELDGHKVIANLSGKHGRVRTIKLPVWLWRTIMEWGDASGMDTNEANSRIFVPITKDGNILTYRDGLTPHAIYKLVNVYTKRADVPRVKPHDLRRTAALLSRKGGATIEQVQIMLGHASPQTTSDYIGDHLDLDDNAVDYNPLRA